MPCEDLWRRLSEIKRDLKFAPSLKEKVLLCGRVNIKNLLSHGDYSKALQIYHNIKKIAGDLPSVFVSFFDDKVKEIYRQAYLMEDVDPDRAREIYRRIVNITPSESEYNQKAKARLQ